MGGLALACAAGQAEAAGARLHLSIPPKPYADALIDLGVQGDLSILGTSLCGHGGRTELSGRYTLAQALDRLLTGAPCHYRIVDANTVRIIPKLAPPAAPAREPPRTTALVSELIVTATKRPAALGRLPAGVSAVSGAQIAATRAVDVGQIAGQLAGVLTTNLGPGRDKLLIRGLSDGAFTGRTRSTVSSYLDDAPVNYNTPDPDLRLVDVERVEVMRGPQGALYGSGSMAGIYRIVTMKPDLGSPAAGGSAMIGQTKGGETNYDLDGYLNVPLVQDRVGLRVVAYREVQGGYLDDVNLRIANVDQTRRDGGRVALRIQLDEDWRLDAMAATQHLRSNDTQYVTRAMPGVAGPQRNAPATRANRIREAHNNDFAYGGGTLQGVFGWGSVNYSLSYVHHVFSSQFDASQAEIFNTQAEQLGVFVESTRSNMLVQELVIRSPGSGPLDWLVGAYASQMTERTPSELGVLAPGAMSTFYTEERKDRLRELALYGEATYAFGSGWSATVGARVFRTRVHTTAQIEIADPGYESRFFDQARTFDGFSPKLSLQKTFANGDLLYASLSEGHRPGGFNSSGFFAIRSNRSTFKRDRLRNYEVGFKLRRFDNRFSVRGAAYYDEWADIQTDQYRLSGLAYTANVGDARIVGLEAEAAYDWPFGLSLQLNGLLSDSELRNPNPDFAPTFAKELPGVPNISGGLLAIYERPAFGDVTLRLVGEASYVGRSSLGFDAARRPRMGHYLRAKLSAELATDTWRVTAFVSNPFDDAGDTFAYGNPFSFGEVRQVTPQRPRTVGVRVAVDF